MTKYQVFISSTYEDMKEERQAAMSAILSMKHIPAGMEYFPARYLDQFEVIKSWIAMCDIFLLILGGRYGSICDNTGKSFVEMELEYAERTGKPIIAVIIDKGLLNQKKAKAYQTGNGAIYDNDRIDRYNGFLKRIRKMRGTYATYKELELLIVGALQSIVSDPDCILNGWVPRLSKEGYEPENMIIRRETVSHFLHRFLHSLSFEEVTERLCTGGGHFISDIRELYTGEWDYYTYDEADITYQRLSEIQQTIVDDRLLECKSSNFIRNHPADTLVETIKLHFKDSLESLSIQIIHHISPFGEPDSPPRIFELDSYLGRYVAERLSAEITYRNLKIQINFSK